jgi:hypothetical protein
MNQQTVELSVWLGMAFLALAYAGLSRWHVRRRLNPLRPDDHLSHGRLVQSAPTDEAGLVRAP